MRFGILGPRLTIVTLGVALGLLARVILGPPAVDGPAVRQFQNPEPTLPAWAMAPEIESIEILPREDRPPQDLPEDWYLDLPLSRPSEKAKDKKRP